MEKVKWGVLGTANIARGCTIPGMKLANNCELYAVAGRNPEKAEAFKNDVRASFNVGMILGKDTNARYDRLYVHGSKGSIRSAVEYNQAGDISYQIFTDDGVTERKISVPQNYSLEIEQLGRCILNGENPHITSDFSIKNAELMDRVFEEIGYYE